MGSENLGFSKQRKKQTRTSYPTEQCSVCRISDSFWDYLIKELQMNRFWLSVIEIFQSDLQKIE